MSKPLGGRLKPQPDAHHHRSPGPGAAAAPAPWSDVTLFSLLSLFAVFPYLNTLLNSFVYDDHTQIENNPYLLSFRHLGTIFSTTVWSFVSAHGSTNYYRPVMTLGYLICFQLFGAAPYGFHLANLALHAVGVCILFLVSLRLFVNRSLAFCAAAVFALHPIHSESVAWVAAITDIELAVFFLLTFWCFLRLGPQGGSQGNGLVRQFAMSAAYVLALLSKEQALTLPVLATAFEHFYRIDCDETSWARKLSRYGTLWLLAVIYVVFRIAYVGGLTSLAQRPDLNVPAAALSAVALVGQYLFKLVWPAQLQMYYSFHKSVSLLDPRVLAGATALLACAGLFLILWRRARMMSFALVWILVTLAPVLNARWFSPNVFAERYLYLPSVGFSWLAGWALLALWEKATARGAVWRLAVLAGVGALAALCVFRIVTRNRDWKDDETLYWATLAAAPDAYTIRTNLGSVYWDHGDVELARQQWLEALRWAPSSAIILNNLGLVYAKQKVYPQAVDYYQRALRVQPSNADAHLNLGVTFREMGHNDSAEAEFRAAIEFAPMNFQARNRLGKLYAELDRRGEAEEQFRYSLEVAPNVVAYDGLGALDARQGKRESAERAFQSALALNPRDSRACFGLGALYMAAGRNAEAVQQYQAGLRIDPDNHEARAALQKLMPHSPDENRTKP